MIYGTVRALGMQRLQVKGDVNSFSLELNGQLKALPEEDELICFVPEPDIHQALMKMVKNCSLARDEDELNEKFASYIQCLYQDRYALFMMTPSESAFGRGPSQTVEIFKSGRDDLPRVGWVSDDRYHETTVMAAFDRSGPLASFQKAEELALRDLAAGICVRCRDMEQRASAGDGQFMSELAERSAGESFDLELCGVQVVRRAVDVDKRICFVAVRIPKSGIHMR
jgi:hypothetical protein